jgi:osmotically-inducible protein OsmY
VRRKTRHASQQTLLRVLDIAHVEALYSGVNKLSRRDKEATNATNAMNDKEQTMYHHNDVKKYLAMAAFMGLALAAAGCDKQTSSGETVGQKVDRAIDKTNAAAGQAENKIGEAAKSAEQAVKGTAEIVKVKASEVGKILDDTAITAAIKADLVKDPGLSALKIEVSTFKGEVTLKGEVDSEAARARAGSLASAVSGVVKVNNSISVKG